MNVQGAFPPAPFRERRMSLSYQSLFFIHTQTADPFFPDRLLFYLHEIKAQRMVYTSFTPSTVISIRRGEAASRTSLGTAQPKM